MSSQLRIVAPGPGNVVEVRPMVAGEDVITQADDDLRGEDSMCPARCGRV